MNAIETGPSYVARDFEVWSRYWTDLRADRRSPRCSHVTFDQSTMKSRAITICSLLLSATLWLSPDGKAADQTQHQQSVKIPASQIHRDHSGIVQHGGEILLGPAYGDMKTGRHGSFMFFPAGFVSLKHSHTYDYYAVVIKGTIANPLEGEKDLPLPPGSYWYQKGGEPHWTKCISKVPCTIFLVSDGLWDAQVLEKE